ncbi:hypothetical protein SUGI_0917280 [Cryptomeria japonica]|nr:hypothetical protein SUGI_0917280 [Cryptomeria japonica]
MRKVKRQRSCVEDCSRCMRWLKQVHWTGLLAETTPPKPKLIQLPFVSKANLTIGPRSGKDNEGRRGIWTDGKRKEIDIDQARWESARKRRSFGTIREEWVER